MNDYPFYHAVYQEEGESSGGAGSSDKAVDTSATEDSEQSDLTPEQWKTVAKKARAEAAKYRVRLNEYEAEVKKANEAKKAQEKAEAEAQEAEAKKRGEFEKLYNETVAALSEAKEQVAALQAKLQPFETKAEETRLKLLNELPEETRANFENSTLEQIKAIVKLSKTGDSKGGKPANTVTKEEQLKAGIDPTTGKFSFRKFFQTESE
jgi:uncharacterized membrane protein YqiK